LWGQTCKVAISSERRMWIHHRDTEGTKFDKEARKAGGRAKDLSLAEGAEIAEKEGLVLSTRERARLDKRRFPSGQVTRQGSHHGPVDQAYNRRLPLD